MEIVDGASDDLATNALKRRNELVREHRLARSINSIDRHTYGVIALHTRDLSHQDRQQFFAFHPRPHNGPHFGGVATITPPAGADL